MSTLLPPEAIAAAAEAMLGVRGSSLSEIATAALEAGAPAILAAERESIRQLADSVGASYIPACRPGECGPLCGTRNDFSYLLRDPS